MDKVELRQRSLPQQHLYTWAWVHFINCLVVLTSIYITFLLGWAGTSTWFGDRWWWLFLINCFSFYFFLPLPVVLVLAICVPRRMLRAGVGAAFVLWFTLYGSLFLPRIAPPAPAPGSPTITIMSYNMLRHNQHPEGVVAAIHDSNADIVALQELNHSAAHAIEQNLAARYPYQVLQPQIEIGGMGILSRYPLHVHDVAMPPASWLGGPQVVELDISGTPITLLNFHAVSTSLGKGGPLRFVPSTMAWSIREREEQAHALASFAANHPQPLLAVGDLNTTDQSDAYAIVRSVLGDAWRTAGWGPGNTFPGAASSGSSRPTIAGLPIPMWLVRIDYIFYSSDWQVLSAQIGPWDGVSDHRSLLAILQLRHRDD